MDPAPEHSRRSRTRRWLPVVVAVVIVADIAAAAGTAIYQAADRPGKDSPPRKELYARAVPGGLGPGSVGRHGGAENAADRSDRAASSRRAAVRELLDQRARAVRTGDRAGFLATIDDAAPSFVRAQERLFRNLRRLPLGAWKYEIVTESAEASARPKRSSPNVWSPRLRLRYRFAGFDERAVTSTRHLTFAYGAQGWRITGVADGTDREVWDLGKLVVARKGDVLAIGVGVPRSRLRRIATRMNQAMPVVSGIWGRDWSRRAVVLVPETQRQTRALSPERQGSLDQITAIATVAPGPSGVPPPGTGDRVIVNPENFSRLSALGRRVVLTHELTHVATRGSTGPQVPMWLVEGFADYVGYKGVELPERRIARQLVDAVHTGHLPTSLPSRADFARDAGHLTRAYESAWLACELVADRHGEQRLVRLYRMLGSAEDGPAQRARIRRSLRKVLDTTPDQFTADWRSYVRVTLQ